ncbi:uncharacterized protein LOC124921727 [Impatiens glandulifera]|uniref:uncharacterized protein LOC124921727 n=1 Tax=Impatiens glandulifera TaxID=253017 RepID=UPI001FB18A8F|nr:uncharacterized protein LOC124921727 [Impatiens glandulifera]
MAVDLWPDNNCSLGISPRISFSHDLSQCDGIPVEQSVFRSSSSNNEFDFCCTHYGYEEQESSSADELFSGGKILPTEIKKKSSPLPRRPPQEKPTPSNSQSDVDVAKTNIGTGSDEKQTSKSFWRFKRSSSLNCAGSGYARSLCPLPLLSRSNSTGSSAASSVKRSSQGTHVKSYVPSPLKPSTTNQKPPLKKNYNNNNMMNTSGVRMNPALNVHSGNLFGLGSIFSGGKDRNKKK